MLDDRYDHRFFIQLSPSAFCRGSAAVKHVYRNLVAQERDRRRQVENNIQAYAKEYAQHIATIPRADVGGIQRRMGWERSGS